MASEDDELNLDTAAKKSGGGLKMLVIMVVVALVVSASIIGTLYFTGFFAPGGGTPASAEVETGDEVEVAKEKKPAIYVEMGPAFIVNFPDDAVAEYLQIEMQALVREKKVADVMATHMPVIRNDILLLLSSQHYGDLKSREGKQQLQEAVLEKIRKVVRDGMVEQMEIKEGEEVDTSSLPTVENVYFTSFIMQ